MLGPLGARGVLGPLTGGRPSVASGPEDVIWEALVNCSADGNTLTKTGLVDGWDAGAISSRGILSGEGYVEFSLAETTTRRMCGLSKGNTGAGFGEIDFAFYPAPGAIYVFENGSQKGGSFGTYNPGDVLRVSVEAGAVTYRKNGDLLYTSLTAPDYPLLVDSSLRSPGATITSAVLFGSNLGDNGV